MIFTGPIGTTRSNLRHKRLSYCFTAPKVKRGARLKIFGMNCCVLPDSGNRILTTAFRLRHPPCGSCFSTNHGGKSSKGPGKTGNGRLRLTHLAYSIWQDRVVAACHKDWSYAIAHDLEANFWEEIKEGADRKGNPKTKWAPKDLSEKDLRRILNEKTGR